MQILKYVFPTFFLFTFFTIQGEGCERNINIPYPGVLNVTEWNIDALLDQGESHLLKQEYVEAKKVLTEAIDLCKENPDQDIRLCRGLFDRSIANASMGLENDSLCDIKTLQGTLENFQCKLGAADDNEYMAGGKPILGPDIIDIDDCIERAGNTIGFIKDIIGFAPVSNEWKVSFIAALYVAESKARDCCIRGGVWKACLQPLLHRWLELKEWERECRRTNHWYILEY